MSEEVAASFVEGSGFIFWGKQHRSPEPEEVASFAGGGSSAMVGGSGIGRLRGQHGLSKVVSEAAAIAVASR